MQTATLPEGRTISLKVIKYSKRGWVRVINHLSLLYCTLSTGKAHYGITETTQTIGPTRSRGYLVSLISVF